MAKTKNSILHGFYGMLLLGTCLWLVPGCGDQSVDYPHTRLTGTVTVNGKPLEEGWIRIMPGGQERGGGVKVPIKAGRYTADQVPLGKVLVTFNAIKATGRMMPSSSGDKPVPEYVNLIPEACVDGIEITVTEGHRDQDFQL